MINWKNLMMILHEINYQNEFLILQSNHKYHLFFETLNQRFIFVLIK